MTDSTATGVGGKTRRGRIIALPGLGGSSATFPWLTPTGLPAALAAQGWQVVQTPNILQGTTATPPVGGLQWGLSDFLVGGIPQPFAGKRLLDDCNTDPGNGNRFRVTNEKYFDHLVDFCNFNYPPSTGSWPTTVTLMPTFIIGMSWGAWWGLNLAMHRGGNGPCGTPQNFTNEVGGGGGGLGGGSNYKICGAYVHCPVNRWNNLNTANTGFYGWNQLTTQFFQGMNHGPTDLNNVTIPVRATWSVVDGFITQVDPPIDAITMVQNGAVALGGAAVNGTVAIPSGQSLGVGTAFASGTGVLNLGTIGGTLPPASALGSSPGPQALFLNNINGAGGFGPVTYVALQYTGISGTTLTGCYVAAIGGSGTIFTTASSYGTAASATGTWAGIGHGSVTGQGQAENHTWDGNGTLNPDSDDCLQWFENVIQPAYPFAY